MGNPSLYDISSLLQAGLDPRNMGIKKGIVDAYVGTNNNIKNDIKRFIRIQDEQDALNRFTWYNLPPELDGNLIERILFYKGQGMFFYIPTIEKFFFLPYALSGTIDVYGRYMTVTPVPFAGGKTDADGKEMPWVTGLTRDVLYQVLTEDDIVDEDMFINNLETKCVLLSDFSKQLSQNNIPRSVLQESLIDLQSDIIPFMRTNLLASTGIAAMRVNSEDEQSNVKAASDALYMAALSGKKWIPVIGNIDFQDLSTSQVAQAESYFMAYQSLDNLRMSGYGLGGGVFNKLGSTLQSEANLNSLNTQLILQDCLNQRQSFCNIVNSLFGTQIWCDIADSVQMQDMPSEAEEDAISNNDESQNNDNKEGGNINE